VKLLALNVDQVRPLDVVLLADQAKAAIHRYRIGRRVVVLVAGHVELEPVAGTVDGARGRHNHRESHVRDKHKQVNTEPLVVTQCHNQSLLAAVKIISNQNNRE
jgi:hypothetical protein